MVCRSIDIRNSVEGFKQLENCTVIEGKLHILLIDHADEKDYEKYRFPMLREITGHLLLYRVYGLKTLRHIFPNLTIIRGQDLFYNYALVAYEMPDLEEIGLISLTTIMRGAVRLTKNKRLCYVDTIDWSRIAVGMKESDHHIQENKDARDCVNYCPENCPRTEIMERRCLTQAQCLNMSHDSDPVRWKLLRRPDKTNECVDECPTGYMPNENETECIKCNKSCPKVCVSKLVDSIDSAQDLKGCNKISGPLEIQIMGGSNIGLELEKSLGEIEEVTQYIEVVRSYALLSLHFLRSLKVIGGNVVDKSYSLRVIDNTNMQELFTEEVTKNLKILKGKVSFHSNRKLCLDKIDTLVQNLNMTVSTLDVSRTTNGDLMPCAVKWLDLRVQQIFRNAVILRWQKVTTSDQRQVLNYIINYREIDPNDKEVDIYQGRDACSNIIWKTIEVPAEQAMNETDLVDLVPNLRPWTTYAVYVQAYMLKTATHQAITKVINFTTLADYPTSPVDLMTVANAPGELLVTWKKPKFPNGNVTHYLVYWQRQKINTAPFDQRDYCKNPIDTSRGSKQVVEVDQKGNNVSRGADCCECPKSKEQLKLEERERQIEIEFENYLHDHVYCKRHDALPAGIDKKYNLTSLTHQPLARTKRQVDVDPKMAENALGRYSANGNAPLSSTPAPDSSTATNMSNATEENTFLQALIYDTKIHLMNLGHFEEYSIEVLACQETDAKAEKLCSNRAISVARTKAKPDADNINATTVEAKLIANSTGEVMLKWAPPKDPNGLVLNYLIRYRRANQEDHLFIQVCVSQKKYSQLGGHRLSNINPGNYTFQIAAVSLAGNGSYTTPMYFVIPPPPEPDRPLNETVVAVTIISILLVIIIVIVVVWFVAKSRFTHQDMTVISPNPGYMPSDDLYIPDEWEVDRDKIRLVKELGQGSFGMVYEGIAEDLIPGSGEVKVAIKTVNDNAGFQERMNFLKEATTMKAFDCYHVVKLLGVVSKGQPALVIMELMSNGDLKNYLRMHRPDENPEVEIISYSEILQMAGEIADGMAYLSAKKFVHRDLAARNCMVSDQKVVKIGDFGMTRDIYETDYYRKGGKGLLPVRWMAPESLKDGVFTCMSDMWSYGVVLWEMATLACQPYQGLSNEEVVKFVVEGRIMDEPPGCPEKLWEIMRSCWRYKARERPTFKQIIEKLIPHLNGNFEKVSFFFTGDDSHSDNGEDAHCSQIEGEGLGEEEEEEGLGDIDGEDIDLDDIDDVGFVGMDTHEESKIPFMAAEDLSHRFLLGSAPLGVHRGSPPSPRSPTHSLRGVNLNGPSSSSSSTSRPARGVSGLPVGGMSGSGSGSPVECVMLEELPNGHRLSTCSSPTSANAPSDDSKGSSKSSGSYSHMNVEMPERIQIQRIYRLLRLTEFLLEY
nr:hypothetical protein BaRGS_002552 [Batillaria attramentaria]